MIPYAGFDRTEGKPGYFHPQRVRIHSRAFRRALLMFRAGADTLEIAWTRRRVRAVFHKEASRIDHREIREMEAVIEARKRHAEYREETAAIAAMALVRKTRADRDLAS